MVAPSSTATSKSWLVPIDSELEVVARRPVARAAARPARAGREIGPRRPPGRSANGGIVIRPAKTHLLDRRRALDERVDLLGRHAVLVSSPATFTSSSTRAGRSAWRSICAQHRLALDRVDQPHARQHLLGLAALEVADEVPRERVAPALLLGDQRLGRVLADERRCRPPPARPSARPARTWSPPGSRPRRIAAGPRAGRGDRARGPRPAFARTRAASTLL